METHFSARAGASFAARHPVGLFAVFAGEDDLPQTRLACDMASSAAKIGQSVLLIDAGPGDAAGHFDINTEVTLGDVLHDRAALRDAKYIAGDIALCSAGDAALDTLLGPIAALSLSYDCVIVLAPAGCTPAHVELASAADATALLFDYQSDRFMRAYWMLDAIRARAPKCDPFMVGAGPREAVLETFDLFTATVRDFLGGPPPFGGNIDGADAQPCAGYIIDALSRPKTVGLRA